MRTLVNGSNPIQAESPGAVYAMPATPLQVRLWNLEKAAGSDPSWNVAVRFTLSGPLDREAFEGALQRLCDRHEILRTALALHAGGIAQQISPRVTLPVEWCDLRKLDGTAQAAEVLRLSLDHARQIVPLDLAPLWRVRVLRLADTEHCLLWNFSHAVCDGWSVGLLARDLMRTYGELLSGQNIDVEGSLDYGDYAVWLDAFRRTPAYQSQRDYWKRRLHAAKPAPLPASWRNSDPSACAVLHSRLLPSHLTDRLGEIAQRQGATFFHAVLAVFALRMRLAQSSPEVALGTPVSGRDQEELESIAGTFVNYVPLGLHIDAEKPYSDVLRSVCRHVTESLDHASFRFEDMLADLGSGSGQPAAESDLFSAVFICQKDFVHTERSGDLSLAAMPSVSAGALRPLTVFMVQRADGWRLSCEVDNRRISSAAGAVLLDDLERWMMAAVESPEKAIALAPARIGADSAGAEELAAEPLRDRALQTEPEAGASVASGGTITSSEGQPRRIPATEAQTRFWLLDRVQPGETSFDLNIRLNMEGPLDVDALKAAANLVTERHEILRTTLEEQDGEVWQIVHPRGTLDFQYSRSESPSPDLEMLRDGEPQAFSLTKGPLFQIRLLEIAPERHWLVIVLSHAIADGWSSGLFLEELRRAYEQCHSGDQNSLQPPVQFSEYAESERALLEGPESGRRVEWWRQHLQGSWRSLALPMDVPEAIGPENAQAATSSTTLAVNTVNSVRRLARECGATPFAVFGAALQVLLSRYSSQQDILFLTPFANRMDDTESVIGPLAIPVCLTGRVTPNATFRELVAELSRFSTAAMEHALPLSLVAPLLDIRVENGQHPLNQITFFYQRAFVHEMQWGPIAVEPLPEFHAGTGSEWQLGVIERNERTSIEFLYRTALYSEQTMALVGRHYGRLLASAVVQPDLAVSQLQFVTQEEMAAQAKRSPMLPVTQSLLSPVEAAGSQQTQPTGLEPQAELQPQAGPHDLSSSERDMLKIWQSIFKSAELNRESDFFDLGGHSLLLARLQIAVKKNFNMQLSAADVFRQPTLGGLTAWLEEARSTGQAAPENLRSNPRIIPIQAHGKGRPIFVISQSLIFRTLASELGEDQPVYALQMLDEDITPELASADFEKLIDFYVRLIRTVQPKGPYRLAGWCVSGWIGYGIARRFEREGERIEMLMIMDAWAPGYWMRQSWARRTLMQAVYRTQRFRWVGRRLRQANNEARSLYLRRSLHGMAAAAARNFAVWLHRMNLPVRPPRTEEMRRSEQVEFTATRSFEVGPLSGQVLLFRSEEQPSGPLLAADMGWSRLIGRPMTVEQLPGDHQEIFDQAGARIMADSARRILGMAPAKSAPNTGVAPLRPQAAVQHCTTVEA